MPRKQIDWEAIEKEYRAGTLSIREIARRHNVANPTIVQRAKRYSWKRDLTDKVKLAVARRLANTSEENAQEDHEIVEAAASEATRVVLCHRKDARQQSTIVNRLIDEVGRRIEGKEKQQALAFDDIRIVFAMLRDSSQALLKLTQIERQAYSLDSGLNAGVTSVLSPDKIAKPDNAGISD